MTPVFDKTLADTLAACESLAVSLETIDELKAARDRLDALRRPFNLKIIAMQKAEREAARLVKEEAAEKLCQALRPGEHVLMTEHGYLGVFNGGQDVFFNKEAVVHCYQPRKRILWLNVTGTRGREKFERCRPFNLHDVASYNVRRKEDAKALDHA